MPVQQGIGRILFERFIYDSEVYYTTTSNALQTVLDITGRGKASIVRPMVEVSELDFLKITLDGNVIINDRNMSKLSLLLCFYNILDFNNSLKIEYRNFGGVNEVRLLIYYRVN